MSPKQKLLPSLKVRTRNFVKFVTSSGLERGKINELTRITGKSDSWVRKILNGNIVTISNRDMALIAIAIGLDPQEILRKYSDLNEEEIVELVGFILKSTPTITCRSIPKAILEVLLEEEIPTEEMMQLLMEAQNHYNFTLNKATYLSILKDWQGGNS